MSDVLTERATISGEEHDLMDSAVLAFDFANHFRAEVKNEYGQGWMKDRSINPEDPRYAYIDKTTFYDTLDELENNGTPHVSILVMTEMGKVTLDSVHGIQPYRDVHEVEDNVDEAELVTPTIYDARRIVYSAIDRLANRVPGVPYDTLGATA